jgi:hypothetical protein
MSKRPAETIEVINVEVKEKEKKIKTVEKDKEDYKKNKVSIENFTSICMAIMPSTKQNELIYALQTENVLKYVSVPGFRVNYFPKDLHAEITDPVDQLLAIGCTAVPVIPPEVVSKFTTRIMAHTWQYEGMIRDKYNPVNGLDGTPLTYSFGSSGLLGHPGSFHNVIVRALRMKAFSVAQKLFESYAAAIGRSDTLKLQMLFDRVMLRPANKAPTGESWHRDMADPKKKTANDIIFGGWINLTGHDQHFCFIPGSHLGFDTNNTQTGFVNVDDMIKTLKVQEKDKAKIPVKLQEVSITFRVPPGYMVIFPQHILHCVLGTKVNHVQCRLFTGWRLTISDRSIYMSEDGKTDLLDSIIENQGVPPLPSSGDSVMYYKMHLVCHKKELLAFSSQFEPRLLVDGLVPRIFPSMKEAGFTLYEKYRPEEIAIFKSNSLKNQE